MKFFEKRASIPAPATTTTTEEIGGINITSYKDEIPISRKQALEIPAVKDSVTFISDLISSLNIKLYEGDTEVLEDSRVKLLNIENNDIMSCSDMIRNLIIDYLLLGHGHIYIKKQRNEVVGLYYVEGEKITAIDGVNPIIKNVNVMIQGENYEYFDFINLCQNSKNGVTGVGAVNGSNLILNVAYSNLRLELSNIKNNGLKRGFLQSGSRLSKKALDSLRGAWNSFRSNGDSENCLVLNDGVQYKEIQQTGVEMQLQESKINNSKEIYKLFGINPAIIEGKAEDEEFNNWIRSRIMPLISVIESALNSNLLKEDEKGIKYFKIDDTNLLKGDIEKRYKAYETALNSGWKTKNEVRKLEGLKELEGLDTITLSLGNVLYNTKTKEYYTPNTGEVKEGEKDAI